MSRALPVTLLCLLALPAGAAERRPMDQVSVEALVDETQEVLSEDQNLNLAWWIPIEFWQASLESQGQGRAAGSLATIEHVFLVVTVQAEISAFGSFSFHEAPPRIVLQPASGAPVEMEPMPEPPQDMLLVLEMLKPILSRALGPLGENLNFYVFSDRDAEGRRLVSPYEPGRLVVQLPGIGERPPAELAMQLPLDALYLPRHCANGRPAHISWTHCPWGGEKLPD